MRNKFSPAFTYLVVPWNVQTFLVYSRLKLIVCFLAPSSGETCRPWIKGSWYVLTCLWRGGRGRGAYKWDFTIANLSTNVGLVSRHVLIDITEWLQHRSARICSSRLHGRSGSVAGEHQESSGQTQFLWKCLLWPCLYMNLGSVFHLASEGKSCLRKY